MKSFYNDIYAKQVNNTVMYNRDYKWFTFYIKGVAVTRKVYKNKQGCYFIRMYKDIYEINTYIFNEKLSMRRNPIIDF